MQITKDQAEQRISNLERRIANGLNDSQTKLRDRLAKVSGKEQVFTNSFDLELFVQETAQSLVLFRMQAVLKDSEGQDARVRYQALKNYVEREALKEFKPNSTSNQSVELDITEGCVWRDIYNGYFLDVEAYGTYAKIAEQLGITECQICEEVTKPVLGNICSGCLKEEAEVNA